MAHEQRVLAPGSVAEQHWRRAMAGFRGPATLVTALPPPACDAADAEVGSAEAVCDAAMVARLSRYAAQQGVTPATVCHAAWAAVQHALGAPAAREIAYGCTLSGRDVPVAGVSQMVTPAVNTAPMRVAVLPAATAAELVRGVHAGLLAALQHAAYPLSSIQRLCPEVHGPLFSAIVDYQATEWGLNLAGGVTAPPPQVVDRIGTPLSLRFVRASGGGDGATLRMTVTSEFSFYDARFLRRLLGSLRAVLARLIDTDNEPPTVGDLLALVRPARAAPLWAAGVPRPPPPTAADKCEEAAEAAHDQSHGVSVLFGAAPCTALQLSAAGRGLGVEAVACAAFLLTLGRYTSARVFLLPVRLTAAGAEGAIESTIDRVSTTFADAAANVAALLVRATADGAEAAIGPESTPHTSRGGACFVRRGAKPLKGAIRAAVYCEPHGVEEHPQWQWRLWVSKAAFPPEVVSGMLQMYGGLLRCLCDNGVAWDRRPGELLPAAAPAQPLALPCAPDTRWLHEPFLARCAEDAEAVALVCDGAAGGVAEGAAAQQLSYGALEQASRAVWERLAPSVQAARAEGGEGPPVVAVVADKGWEQVAGVLGVLRAGGAYLPVNAKQLPRQRIEQLLRLSDACAVVVDARTLRSAAWLAECGLPVVDATAAVAEGGGGGGAASELAGGVCDEASDATASRRLAYLIYTSGSTGVPKGVCCHHQGALNTLLDLNERYGVGRADRVLALSSLSFDLSVYDVFGLLSAGASVVVPPSEVVSPPDPAAWLRLVVSHGVTVWNTVPAFMELLVAHAEHARERLPASLRLVWLSGDWVPLSLPARIRALSECAELRVVSMGGATEAAIWSNLYEVGESGAPEGWSSIPYGRPLRNQTMYVLDEQHEHCEPWVTGAIHIGGVGVAHGYYKDAARSAAQFVRHPRTGEALFRTGDLGRLRPCGMLEILGREDAQVKLNGFRVELGEVEHALASHPLVRDAAVALLPAANGQTFLAAFVTLHAATPSEQQAAPSEAETTAVLASHLRGLLPAPLLPSSITALERLPLTSNGKVDRSTLVRQLKPAAAAHHRVIVPAATANEQCVLRVWASVLGIAPEQLSVDANFFQLGGDSLNALRLVAEAHRQGLPLSVRQVFEQPTIRQLAALVPDAVALQAGMKRPHGLEPLFRVRRGGGGSIGAPFPLIGITRAYYVGLYLSPFSEGLNPQIYFEWEWKGRCDATRLQAALNAMVARHAVWRAIVTADGMMRILPDVPAYTIAVETQPAAATREHLLATRTHMVEHGPRPEAWPLFECRISHTSAGASRVHFCINLFIMDGAPPPHLARARAAHLLPRPRAPFALAKPARVRAGPAGVSDLTMRSEISALYHDLSAPLPQPRLTYQDYCVSLCGTDGGAGLSATAQHRAARSFWSERIPSLPPPPELPVLPAEGDASPAGRFDHIGAVLSAETLGVFKARCAAHAVTPTSVMLTIYALVLARFATSRHFLLNILHCLRHPVDDEVTTRAGEAHPCPEPHHSPHPKRQPCAGDSAGGQLLELLPARRRHAAAPLCDRSRAASHS